MKVEVTICIEVELPEELKFHEFQQSTQYRELRSEIHSAIYDNSYLKITDCVFRVPVPKGLITQMRD
jgi:hypothetical protein